MYDLAYRGKTAAVKILLNENDKLKTQTDNVRILRRHVHRAAMNKVKLGYVVHLSLLFFFLF